MWQVILESLQLHAIGTAVAQLLQEPQLQLKGVLIKTHPPDILGAIVYIQLLRKAPWEGIKVSTVRSYG